MTLLGCRSAQSALEPASPEAARIAVWWWIMLTVAVIVFAVVLTMLLLALLRRRAEPASNEPLPELAPRDRGWTRFVLIAGALVPALVLGILMGLNIISEGIVTAEARPAQLTIQVIGHRWWWEVYYPEQHFATANEIHIPVGQPVKLKLSTGDVIHSFWVPQLEGKRDMIPGQTNILTLQADKPGTYRGQCAEFCGTEHAKMAFTVVAEAPEAFTAWTQAQRQSAPPPTDPLTFEGQQVFQGSACVYCHTLRGTNASSRLGPDLTHIASRKTLGAGALANSRANLYGWIVNSQAIKPGNKMPPMYLSPEETQALVAYLETLK